MKKLFILLIIGFVWASDAWATTATFQEGVSGYAGTQDATINSGNTNEHITDTSTNSRDNTRYYILQFDLTSIATNATVSSATIQLYMSEQNCTSESVGAHQIANPDSGVGFTSNSAEADVFNQYATWRYKNETGTVKWSTGGGSSNFTDVNGNAAENTVASGACPGSVAKTITVTNMVQSWITTPTNNLGMYLAIEDASGNVKFENKRAATSANRPLLTVTYTTPSGVSHTNTIVNSTIRNSTIN